MTANTMIPRTALLLGWAGVLPFAALSVMSVWGDVVTSSRAIGALLNYAAVILGFMSGVQWGIAMLTRYRDAGPGTVNDIPADGWRMTISVVPALAGFAALLVPSDFCALAILVTSFAALLGFDLLTVQRAAAPAWYGRLRVQLTGAVVLFLLLATLAATD
ncbi:MAG: DUF3429 domain-containing protein [Pseudomonadota bacterium]